MFFFNDSATTEIYTLSLHDALPICAEHVVGVEHLDVGRSVDGAGGHRAGAGGAKRHALRTPGAHAQRQLLDVEDDVHDRSEENTTELQSPQYLVCRLLLEKKKLQIS